MDSGPVVVQEGNLEWKTWPEEEEAAKKGLVYWKNLVSGDLTHNETLTMGIAKVPPLRRSTSTDTGKPRSTLSSKEPAWSESVAKRPVEAGSAVFIPSNVMHSCENTGASNLRVAYVLAANSFEEVEYIFDE